MLFRYEAQSCYLADSLIIVVFIIRMFFWAYLRATSVTYINLRDSCCDGKVHTWCVLYVVL
jgi:hypothetical protein